MSNLALVKQATCLHCGTPSTGDAKFCCTGCETVYTFLHKEGLEHFYNLKDKLAFQELKNKPKQIKEQSYELSESLSNSYELKLYIEGIHCLGCLWLLEKLPEILPNIDSSSLDLDSNILTIVRKNKILSWNEVIRAVQKLGYSPKIINDDLEKIKTLDTKKQLVRIGVAAFCTGNIMLLSVSIYGGADELWGIRFGWLSLLFALPVLTYSAWPIYKNTVSTLLNKFFSADSAIVLALVSGFIISLWSLIEGSEKYIYFDSLSMLIFLLLSSRFFLQKMREKIGRESPLLNILNKESYIAERISDKVINLQAHSIETRDRIILKVNQTVPVDAKLMSEFAYFDLSMLTGESTPVKFLFGEIVESGSKCLSSNIKIEAQASAGNSRFAKILEQIQIKKMLRTPTIDFADRVAKYFALTVLCLAGIIIYLNPTDEGLRRALALIIVSCPCVLAFSIPLAITKSIQLASKNGILFVNPNKIETLSHIKNIFFDKTGTLTNGIFSVFEWKQIHGNSIETKAAVKSLELQSSHPIAKSLVRYLSNIESLSKTVDIEQVPGKGLLGYIDKNKWSILKNENQNELCLSLLVYKNDTLTAEILVGDSIRDESNKIVSYLKNQNYRLEILSGDSYKNVKNIAEKLSIENWTAELLPEEKSQIVSKKPNSLMIGDGINDAIAFQTASIGVSMQGSVEESAKNSDIIFTEPGLKSLYKAILVAKKMRRTIIANFSISLFYNIIGGSLAILGLINPLWAAVLMPLSAFSVFFWTQIQMESISR